MHAQGERERETASAVYAKLQRKKQRERDRESESPGNSCSRFDVSWLFFGLPGRESLKLKWSKQKPKSAVIKKPQIDNERQRKRRHKKKTKRTKARKTERANG